MTSLIDYYSVLLVSCILQSLGSKYTCTTWVYRFVMRSQATLKKRSCFRSSGRVTITAEWELFFSSCQLFCFWVKISSFSCNNNPKKTEKKDFAAARLATISATRWTGNILFFKGGLSLLHTLSCHGARDVR